MSEVKQINLELFNPNNNKTGKWTILYDSTKITEEKVLNYVEEQKINYSHNFERLLLNLTIVKGMICIPTESVDIAKNFT